MRIFHFIYLTLIGTIPLLSQVAVKAETVYTLAGPSIQDGVVLMKDGQIKKVGIASEISIPLNYKIYEAKVVTPGLIDAHSVVGLAGYLNQEQDQDQLESSSPIQPDLRAIDAYNAREHLVTWLKEHGVTTIHTGHGPGALISGQTLIAKTYGDTLDEAVIKPVAMLAMTLGDSARNEKSPGTRAKMMAMLREQFLKANEYMEKLNLPENGKSAKRDLKLEILVKALKGEIPIMVTADHSVDIANALRLAQEFKLKLILDSGAESYFFTEQLKMAGVSVFIHPTMTRNYGGLKNASIETAAILAKADIPIAIQSGYEGYVPKSRVVLFEAAIAAANGLSFDKALAAITIEPAKILGIDHRVGSIEEGKDGDLVLFNGDPFEYLTRVTGVFINGKMVSDTKR